MASLSDFTSAHAASAIGEGRKPNHRYERRWQQDGASLLDLCQFIYVISLPCPEGLLLDLEGLRKYFNSHFGDDGKPEKHVIIALLVQVKGKHNERQHLIPSVNVTKSGINVCQWLRRTVAVNFPEGRVTYGPSLL